jgi:FMN phosphatase YigB (HAD superfamily)
MIEAVLFDFGGTLVQPKKSWPEIRREGVRATYNFLRKRGLKMSFEEYALVNERVFKKYAEMEAAEDRDIPDILKYGELIVELFTSLSRREELKLASETNDVFWALTARAQTPSKRVPFALRKLRSIGLRMAIISNHHNGKSLRKMLRNLGMIKYFEVVIVSEEVGVRKPNPKIYRICLSRLRLRRNQVIFVGDSLLYDVVGARAADIISVLYAEGAPDELETPRDRNGVMTHKNPGVVPDFITGDLSSLPRVIELLGGPAK